MADKEAKKAKKAEAQAKKETKKVAKKDSKETSAELHQGMMRLTIVPPVDSEQLKRLEEQLYQVEDLRLILIGGSVDGGTEIVVSTENPLPLLDILGKMPPVAQVVKKGKTAQVTLKAG